MSLIKKKTNYWHTARNGNAIFRQEIQRNQWSILPSVSITDSYSVTISCLFCHEGLQPAQFWVHMISHYAMAINYYHEKGLPCTKRKAYNFLLHISLVEGLNGGNPIKEDR